MPDTGRAFHSRPQQLLAAAAPPASLPPLGSAGRRLALLLGSVLALLAASFAALTWQDHRDSLEDGWRSAERAAAGTAEHAARSLGAARLLTDRGAAEIRRQGVETFRGPGWPALTAMLRNAPQVGSLWVLDAQGVLVGSSFEASPPPASYAAAPYFAPLRDGAPTYLTTLLWGRLSRIWFFGHAEAVRDEAGGFLGIVQAAMHAEEFQRFAASLGLGATGRSGLFRLPDGAPVMLVPVPDGPDPSGAPPAVPWAPPREVLVEAAEATEGRYAAPLRDGTSLLVAWHRVAGPDGLVAVVALPREAAFAAFRGRLGRNALLFGLAGALVAGLGWAVAAALAQVAASRRVAEAGRRELSALLEATGEGVIVIDRAWRITFINGRAAIGLNGGLDCVGRPFWDAFPEFFGGAIWRACEETMQCRLPATAEAGHPRLSRRFAVESHPREDGGIVAFFRDVTEERQAVARLAESEARFRTLFSAIDEGYCLCELVFDPAGRPADYRFLEVNPLFHAMTGLQDAAGRTAREMLPDLELGWVETYARVALGGETLRFEQGSDALGRWFDVFATPVAPHGRFALVFKDITARRAAEAALRESEARLRRVLDSLFVFVGVLAPDGTLLEANRAPLEAAGLTIEDVRGRLFWNCFWWSHDEAVQAQLRAACAAAAEGRPSRYDVEVRMAGDSRMTIDFQIAPLRDAEGRITHLIPSASDVTKRREAEAAQAESEARLRLAQEAADVGVFERDLLGGRAHWSPAMFRLWGVDPVGRGPWVEDAEYLALLHPDDREAHRARRDAMRADPFQTRFDFEFRIRHGATGEVRWLLSRGEVVRDAAGRALLVRGVNTDVTDRRRAEERQLLLAREVDHRAKNALAVVQSIVGLTRDADPAQFRAAVTGRIAAMARAHTLLAREGWDGAELRELVEEELAPHRGRGDGVAERVAILGPRTALAPGAAQPLAMALHELATNATKYGALSSPSGRVEIAWHGTPEAGLTLRWTERGGPRVAGPPARRGFGSSVIRNTVERQLGGTTRFDWPESGLDCTLTLPPRQLRWAKPAAGDQPRS
jgi:PAS domain S-box-containing protein